MDEIGYSFSNFNSYIEITHPFLNFYDATVEVWEWVSNSIQYFTMYVITNPCWD